MNLIRKYKISKLLNKPLEGVEKEIILFIQDWLKDLIPFKMDKYPDSIYYMKQDGKYVLEEDKNNKVLWVRYIDFWKVLEYSYSLKDTDIQIILKYMAEEAFKQQVATPYLLRALVVPEVEEAFKQQVATPSRDRYIFYFGVEEAFKQQVATPRPSDNKLPPP
ncbi:MAG: hypothetical protein RLZZ546_1083 [Bacteroidota bacterium]